MNRHWIPRSVVAAVIFAMLPACVSTIPEDALKLSPESLERRQLQSRYFDTRDEAAILSASAAVFQDLGFNLDESETDLGVIVASKKRDATEAGQVAVAILAGVLLGSDVAWDDKQKIRVSLVTRPSGEQGERITVRVTFQRIVWDTEGDVSRIEQIDERKIYRQFFDNLSKSVFLEAHKV